MNSGIFSRLIFLIFCSVLILIGNIYSQTANKCEVSGVVKDGKKNITDGSVTVYSSSQTMTKDKQVSTAKIINGKFKITLDLEKYFLIEVAKEGYVPQLVFFSTNAPKPDIAAGNLNTASFEVDLFRMVDGLNFNSIKDKPTIKIKYSKQDNILDSDKDWEDKMKSKLDEIQKQLVNILQKKFYSECQDAYKFAEDKKYEEAILHYYQALYYYPEDKDVPKKIAAIEKKGTNREQSFQKFKKLGDDAFGTQDFPTAIANYNKALVINPNDAYVKNKVAECKKGNQTAQNNTPNKDTKTSETKKPSVNIKGTVFRDDKRLKDVVVNLLEDNNKVKSITTEEKGEFTFSLDLSKNYIIEITKQGFVTLKVKVATVMPANTKMKTILWNKEFSVNLFEMVEGLNITALKEPVKFIKYFPTTDEFDFDKAFNQAADKKIEAILAQAADLKKKKPVLADKKDTKNVVADNKQPNKDEKKDVTPNKENTDNSSTDKKVENKDDINTKKESENQVQPVSNKADNRTNAQKIDSCLKHIKSIEAGGDKKALAIAMSNVAEIYFDSGDQYNAIEFYSQALKNKEELGDKEGTSSSLMNLGVIYFNGFRYEDALKSFLKSLKLKQELSDKSGEGKALYRIGNVYYEKKEYEKATDYFEKSLSVDKQLKNEKDISAAYNNLGVMYFEQKNYEKAMDYYEKALKINEATGQEKDVAISLNNIGNVNYDWNKYSNALEYYERSLKIKEKIDYKRGIALSLFNIGNVYKQLNKYDKAVDYYNRSADISKLKNFNDILYNVYSALSDIYSVQKNCEKAFEYYRLSVPIKQYSSILSSHRQLSEIQIKYDSDTLKNTEEISLLKEEVVKQKQLTEAVTTQKELELSVKNAELAQKEADLKIQRNLKYSFFGGFFLVLMLALVLFVGYRQKKKANIILAEQKHEIEEKNEELNQQNEEIRSQRDEIEAQKDIIITQRDLATSQRDQITLQKQEITDSIYYAEYIQKALLQSDANIVYALPEHFILFRPRDIVSGDFYWMGKKGDYLIIVAADCTGHGVPGAFMSMLGIAFLNEIVNTIPPESLEKKSFAGDVLNEMREHIIKSLHQTGKEGESKDGMDIALCVLNKTTNIVNYAGAFNPMYLVRGDEFIEVKANKMPIGIFIKEKEPFTNNTVQLQKNDCVYIFSDGFADQFGGPKTKKFGSEAMKRVLQENYNKSMEEQKQSLLKAHLDWKGDMEQIDDIVVIGFRV